MLSPCRVTEQIAAGDPDGVASLYQFIRDNMRQYAAYRLGSQEADDLLHETLTIVIELIRGGHLRNPDALESFVLTVFKRQVSTRILFSIRRRKYLVDDVAALTSARAADNPESLALHRERRELMNRGLRQLRSRDRELLTRFYLHGQSHREICEDMNLTATQFRLYKSRAKAKLIEWAHNGCLMPLSGAA